MKPLSFVLGLLTFGRDALVWLGVLHTWRWGALYLMGGRRQLGVIREPIGPAFIFRELTPDGWREHVAGRAALHEFAPVDEADIRIEVAEIHATYKPHEAFVPSPICPSRCHVCGRDARSCSDARTIMQRRAAVEDATEEQPLRPLRHPAGLERGGL